MSSEREQAGGWPSTRDVDSLCPFCSVPDCIAGGQRADGLPCAVCGWRLEQTSIGEERAGTLQTHVRCTVCGAHGCLSLNAPGKKSAIERGRALTGERHS